ncbi:MAG: hypothetical protein Q9164_004841 [Protoblastenia rupestris]
MSITRDLATTFKINSVSIPAVGLGTFQGDDGNDRVKEIVLKALQRGYRHVDTAAAYGNEKAIGEAIKESGIRREGIFASPSRIFYLSRSQYPTSSQWEGGSLPQTADIVIPRANENAKPVIDHKLSRAYPQTWAAMEKLVDKRKAKLIGISNFNISKTKRILETARIRPAVNQVELHPIGARYLPQLDLLHFSAQEGIHLTAHQPLGGRPIAVVNPNADRPGPILDSDIVEIASAYGKSPAQVMLSWAVQRGTSVVPKTVHEERMVENRELFRLSDEHVLRIDRIAMWKGAVRYLDPRNYIGFDIFDEQGDEPVVDGASG